MYWMTNILVTGTYRCTLIDEITWQWQRTIHAHPSSVQDRNSSWLTPKCWHWDKLMNTKAEVCNIIRHFCWRTEVSVARCCHHRCKVSRRRRPSWLWRTAVRRLETSNSMRWKWSTRGVTFRSTSNSARFDLPTRAISTASLAWFVTCWTGWVIWRDRCRRRRNHGQSL